MVKRQASDLEIRGSNPGPRSNRSLDNLLFKKFFSIENASR